MITKKKNIKKKRITIFITIVTLSLAYSRLRGWRLSAHDEVQIKAPGDLTLL